MSMPTLEDFATALLKHDWYHEYSDDHRVWKAGDEEWRRIQKMYFELRDAGLGEEASALVKKYQPEAL
jgi:hypothetical protein